MIYRLCLKKGKKAQCFYLWAVLQLLLPMIELAWCSPFPDFGGHLATTSMLGSEMGQGRTMFLELNSQCAMHTLPGNMTVSFAPHC